MTTRKYHRKSKKSNKRFRKTRSKRQRGGSLILELIQASRKGDTKTVTMLLEKGVDVNANNNYGETALITASRYGHIDLVKLLFENGADVHLKNKFGETALHSACFGGYINIVEILLKNGAIVNAKDNHNWTALQLASENGHEEIVKMLLAYGADMNAKNENGNTALQVASEHGRTDIVKLLEEAIKIRGNKQKTMEQVVNRDVKIPSLSTLVQQQMSTGDRRDVFNHFNMRPPSTLGGKRTTHKKKRKTKKSRRKLKIKTKRGGYVYSTDWMTEAKTKGEVIPTIENNKILLRELGFSMNPNTKIIIKPKDTKSNIKYFVYDKNDCDTNHIRNCEPILIFKPNTNNPYGRNNGGKRQKGGDETQEEKDKKLLDASNLDEVREALDAGSDVNATDDDGDTALMKIINCDEEDDRPWYQVEYDIIEIVEMLLAAGVDVNVENNDSKTALDIAKETGCTKKYKNLLLNIRSHRLFQKFWKDNKRGKT